MPIGIEGWVEFSLHEKKEERGDKHSWRSWMDISSIVEFNDEVNWVLIGNPRDFKSDVPKFAPVAKERGFPDNPSSYLKLDMNLIAEYEAKHGKGDLFGFTNFNYSEIENIDWEKDYEIRIEESDWWKLFELIDQFKGLKNIKSDQIRIVAWYNW